MGTRSLFPARLPCPPRRHLRHLLPLWVALILGAGATTLLIAACTGETTGTRVTADQAPSPMSVSGPEPAPLPTTTVAAPAPQLPQPLIAVTVVYDNALASRPGLQPGLRPDWGFACLVQAQQATVLFDAGAKGEVLLANLQALGIDPRVIDAVVISHEHSDHTGGLAALLERAGGATVYRPADASEPVEIASGLLLTGAVRDVLASGIAEQGLVVDTAEGPLLITGCAHPGIVRMVEVASAAMGAPVRTVLGGFHLAGASAAEVEDIARRLAGLGVARCGPAHCTGREAAAVLQQQFGAGFIPLGVGAVVEFPSRETAL